MAECDRLRYIQKHIQLHMTQFSYMTTEIKIYSISSVYFDVYFAKGQIDICNSSNN